MSSRVKLNVSGTIFEFDRTILETKDSCMLSELCSSYNPTEEALELTIDRPAKGFDAILSYYQTGSLHIPMCMCPGAFKEELDYWKIDIEELADCCMFRYSSFIDDQQTRRKFLRKTCNNNPVIASKLQCWSPKIRKLRQKLWKVVDNDERSVSAKIYFGLVFCMVMVSIITLSYSTEPSLRRGLSICEILEYMEYTGDQNFNLAQEHFGYPVCPKYSVFLPMIDDEPEYSRVNKKRWKGAMIKILTLNAIKNSSDANNNTANNNTNSGDNVDTIDENTANSNTTSEAPGSDIPTAASDDSSGGSTWTLWSNLFNAVDTAENKTVNETSAVENATAQPLPILVLDNNTMTDGVTDCSEQYTQEQMVFTSEDSIDLGNGTTLKIPILTLPVMSLHIIDSIVLLFFTFDIILRLLSCPSFSNYFLSIVNVLDACALLASYVFFIVISIYRQYRYLETTWVTLLNYVQIFRVFRLFRVVKNVRAAKVLVYSMTQNAQDMLLVIMLLFVSICTFACLFFFAESRETMPSIPMAWYWAVMTMTTVGYGDFMPKTGLGRLIASFCAIAGVLLLAITVPLFVNKFVTMYRYSCISECMDKMKVRRAKASVRKINNNEGNTRL